MFSSKDYKQRRLKIILMFGLLKRKWSDEVLPGFPSVSLQRMLDHMYLPEGTEDRLIRMHLRVYCGCSVKVKINMILIGDGGTKAYEKMM